ncbi:MAG: hypothetical protein PVI51_06600 [candidate division WOR-3 bacterium]
MRKIQKVIRTSEGSISEYRGIRYGPAIGYLIFWSADVLLPDILIIRYAFIYSTQSTKEDGVASESRS